ncbi:hypothetical protein [Aquimarina latercula]|uniref:hypothetical protein n=1 Tax=Aquimarina latercula TaxID=987 RepID=UPI00041AAABA|nr:hypothetical protein [Aquimarina latercula]
MIFNKECTSFGDVSVYLEEKDLHNYYAESFYLLNSHLKYLHYNINKFSKTPKSRTEYYELLYKAFSHNAKEITKLVDLLGSNVDLSAYTNIRPNKTDDTQMLLKDYFYLSRDWSDLDSGENQVNKINEEIKTELSKLKFDTSNALLLGAGSGRFAVDLLDVFDKVYATDKSFSMVWHFQELLKGKSIDFYKPQTKNILKLENVAQKYSAKIPEKDLPKANKVNYFVSDVLNLPFEEKTVNAIFSIYFTDVIALKLWYNQVNKTLTDNGIFIHFGPLDYFFSSEMEMLTAEEFRQFFENNGYTTLVDKVIETPHLEDENSMTYKVYRNWFFVAQKQEKKALNIQIENDSILKITRTLSFETKGVISSEGKKELDTVLELPTGAFEGASPVIEILREIDGSKNYAQVLDSLKKKGFDIANKDQITNLLKDFISQEIITIENI